MLFSSRENDTMNTMIFSFHVKTEISSSIVKNIVISFFRVEESIVLSFIDDEFDANVLNEIALSNFSFTQIRIVRKTSITNVFKKKFNKKINNKFKKVTKKLLKKDKNKKYFVERKFFIVF